MKKSNWNEKKITQFYEENLFMIYGQCRAGWDENYCSIFFLFFVSQNEKSATKVDIVVCVCL